MSGGRGGGGGGEARPRRRILVAAFGDPGHAFPAIALGRALAARGHDVTLQTWRRWQPDAEGEGMRFEPAPEYQAFPTQERPLQPYQAAVRAAEEARPLLRELRPEAVVSDILTLAPALAAEAEGVPWATLVPHVYPPGATGLPAYGLGARPPRTAAGRALWRRLEGLSARGLERGRRELNEARARLGLPPLAHVHGGISRRLCLVATFPQLEYPRAWPASVRVVGPLLWEPPSEPVEPPPGEGPLVLVAPSTAHDAGGGLVRAALEGLAPLPVRVLATTNRRGEAPAGYRAPPNARLVDWLSYERAMPLADVVISHGGHGTLCRALASGCALCVVPAAGDQGENGARVAWAGAGLSVPQRFAGPRALRWVVERLLGEPRYRARAGELATWAAAHDGAVAGADAVEEFVAAAPLT